MGVDLNDDYLPLVQVCDLVPSKPVISTVWRWTTKGCRGVLLETVLIGGMRYTTRTAVERFLNRLNGEVAQ